MSVENLSKFYRLIGQDSEIRSQLGSLSDRTIFVKNMVRLGSENGLMFTANELESALANLESPVDEGVLSDDQLSTVAGGAKRVGNAGSASTECQESSRWLDPFCT